jgi:hypothetical protein
MNRVFPFLLALAFAAPLCAQEEPKPQPDKPKAEEAPQPAKPKAEEAPKKKAPKKGKLTPREALAKLGVDAETKAKALEAMRAARESTKKRIAELRAMGEVDKKQLRELRKSARKEAGKALRQILGKEAYKTFRRATAKGGKGKRGGKGAKGKKAARKKALSSDLVMRTLKLDEEESAVIKPLLDAVLETQKLLRGEAAKRWAAFKTAALEGDDEAVLTKLLKTLRRERAEDEATLNKTREKLREVLSIPQEAKLVALRVLD